MSDPILMLKGVLHWAEFGRRVSDRLGGVRHIHESDDQTLERVVKQAVKTICPGCSGRGTGIVVDVCSDCRGTGERAYDPNEKPVREVMES